MQRARRKLNLCPFIDRDDARCSERFSLLRLNDAFDHCVNGYLRCPVYYEMHWEQARERTEVTVGGRPLAPARPRVGQAAS